MDYLMFINYAFLLGFFSHQSEAGSCFIGQVIDLSINKIKWGAGFVDSVCECSGVVFGGGITVVKSSEEALRHFWFFEEGDILSLPLSGKQPWRQECGSQNPEAFLEGDQCNTDTNTLEPNSATLTTMPDSSTTMQNPRLRQTPLTTMIETEITDDIMTTSKESIQEDPGATTTRVMTTSEETNGEEPGSENKAETTKVITTSQKTNGEEPGSENNAETTHVMTTTEKPVRVEPRDREGAGTTRVMTTTLEAGKDGKAR